MRADRARQGAPRGDARRDPVGQRRHLLPLGHSAALRTAAALLLLGTLGGAARGGEPDPRAVQPERPTVATHAYSVAPGLLETEVGVEYDRERGGDSAFFAPLVAKIGLAARLQLNVSSGVLRAPRSSAGFGDVAFGLKWRVGAKTPLLGDFALLPAVKFPSGAGRASTGTTDLSILAISSRKLGSVGLDLNAGYVRRSGSGSSAPRESTLWAASFSGPLGGPFGFNAELFGYPGTGGRSGTRPVVGITVGPTWQPRPWIAFDAGAIVRVSGPQPNAAYAGMTWNVGRL